MLPVDPGRPRTIRLAPAYCSCHRVILPGQRVLLEHREDGTAAGWRHAACCVRPGAEPPRIVAEWSNRD
jgi:hypothetical protein